MQWRSPSSVRLKLMKAGTLGRKKEETRERKAKRWVSLDGVRKVCRAVEQLSSYLHVQCEASEPDDGVGGLVGPVKCKGREWGVKTRETSFGVTCRGPRHLPS